MPVKKISVNNVVNAGDIVRAQKNGKSNMQFSRQRAHAFRVDGIVDIHRQQFEARMFMNIIENLQIVPAGLGADYPETKQCRLSQQGAECESLAVQIRKRKIRCGYRGDQPRFNYARKRLELSGGALAG